MLSEAPPSGSPALSPRAAVALLTLQLRAVHQEIAALDATAVDVDAMVAELRAKVGPLVEERQRALAGELSQARADGDAAIAAARAEANQLLAEAQERAAAAARARVAEATNSAAVETLEVAEAEFEAPRVPPEAFPSPTLDERPPMLLVGALGETPEAIEIVGTTDLATLVVAEIERASSWPPPAGLATTPIVLGPATSTDQFANTMRAQQASTINVIIDAEAFAQAFAVAIAPVLEARAAQTAAHPMQGYRIVQSAPAQKRSFWAHAWHADVLLSLLAMGIVLAVLVAWTR